MLTRWGAMVAALLVVTGAGATQAQDRAPLVVTRAVPEEASGTIGIEGGGFGPRPFVTLNLVPLTVQFALDSRIVAAAPITLMPPGTYLLTVSRGPLATETASIDVILGGASGVITSAGQALKPGVVEPAARAGSPGAGIGLGNDASLGSPGDVAAKVGDRTITLADVDREWQRLDPTTYVGVGRRVHEMRRRIVDQLVANEVLSREAAARGVTTEALLAEEVPKRIVPLPDSAVLALYQQLGDDTRGASLDQMRPALRAWLARFTEPELARMTFIEELMRVSTRAEVLLAAPRIQVQSSPTDVALGPALAPVQIVAFGDVRNGRYALFAQAFARIRDTFGDRVRFVFKPLPASDPDALAAAEAAQCAQAQGRFWPFHDALLKESGPAGATRIGTLAAEAGLDRRAFDACRDEGQFRSAIHAALDEARRYDIHASPSFLVNGRLAPVPPPFLPPFEFFTRLIEEELQQLGKPR